MGCLRVISVVAAARLVRRHFAAGLSVGATIVEGMADRPFFRPKQAPRGVYRGDVCDLVYEIAPVPEDRDCWLRHFQEELEGELAYARGDSHEERSPRVTFALATITCTVTVNSSATVDELMKVDDAMFNALSNAGAAVEAGAADLEHKLEQVRQRRRDNWPDERYR